MEKGFSGDPIIFINRTLIGIVKKTTDEDFKNVGIRTIFNY